MPDSLPSSSSPMTVQEFEERLFEGDRWIELVDGRFSRLNPPDDAHGDVVRNLARSLATFLKKSTDTYACFELPLILKHDNPTIICPAVSCFRFEAGSRFAETDKVLTDTRPILAIEVASTNERRKSMAEHVSMYLAWGVPSVWVVDPVSRQVQLCEKQSSPSILKESQDLAGGSALPGFSMRVADLFREPSWMKRSAGVPDPI